MKFWYLVQSVLSKIEWASRKSDRYVLKETSDIHYALLQYRNTTRLSTGLIPAQMLMETMLKSEVPVVNSNLFPKSIDNDMIQAKIETIKQLNK